MNIFIYYRLCGHQDTNIQNGTTKTSADATARSSIMFAAEVPNVVMFCDEGTHNRYAPTKHNQMCNRRSTLDVILKHSDFDASNMVSVSPSTIINTQPTFEYKKRQLTRYVLIIDETKDTMVRESWSFLRMAIRKWVVYDLPANTEVGIILANDTASAKIFDISALDVQKNRDYIASFVPFSPSESQRPGCIKCAVKDAMTMLKERHHRDGPANSIILVVAPGMDFNTDYMQLGQLAKTSNIRIATINYPGVIRRQPLDMLAAASDGISHTVYEKKQNGEKSYLTTYFELSNVFYHVLVEYYEGNRLELPMEIHRKELFDVSDENTFAMKRISRQITSAFMLDASMGTPSSFFIYTHNAENPLIQSAKLTSPTGLTTSIRSDQRLPVKQLAISAIISETGTWTYTIDRYNGDPQPHFVQVMATPKSILSPVVLARAWIRTPQHHKGHGPMILYVEVKKGELPVSAALVEVTVIRPEVVCNGTGSRCRETFRLFDTGSGDPDITKGDGIYTRYFNVASTGKGAYKFEIVVTDNGNTAYSLSDNFVLDAASDSTGGTQCCGSFVPVPSKQPLAPFQRVLPAITVFVTQDQVDGNRAVAVSDLGHIGDLKVELLDAMKVRLSWSSPDMGGLKVARYEVKYGLSAIDVIDNFETAAIRWEHDQPFAFSIGDDTPLTMNITAEPELIGKRIFIAIRAYSELTKDARPGPVSNVVNTFIARPAPPSTTRPIHSTDTFFSFPRDSDGETDDDSDLTGASSSKSSLYDLSWEILIPIIAGICLVGILVCGFCYFCIVRRQKKVDFPKKKMNTKVDKVKVDNVINSPIHSIPHHRSTPEHSSTSISQQIQQHPLPNYSSTELDIPDHHTVGLPIYSSEEEIHKKRYSIVNDQEHQLIQKMKHQHIQRIFRPCALSVISSNNNTLTQNGRLFGGPYDSWTPSQLLQEHEHDHDRHHSPYDDMVNQSLMPNSAVNSDQMHMLNQQQQQQQLQPDQYSLMNGNHHIAPHQQHQLIDHMAINGAPPVPPLPYATAADTYPTANIYSSGHTTMMDQPPPTYVTSMNQQRIGLPPPPPQHHQQNAQNNQFNTSLQGSMNSVHSGDKKKTRNVTMV